MYEQDKLLRYLAPITKDLASFDEEKFIECFEKGYTAQQVADEFNMSYNYVNKKKKELGLSLNLEELKNSNNTEVEDISYEFFTHTLPIEIFLGDSESKPVESWRQVYSEICEYLMNLNTLEFARAVKNLKDTTKISPSSIKDNPDGMVFILRLDVKHLQSYLTLENL